MLIRKENCLILFYHDYIVLVYIHEGEGRKEINGENEETKKLDFFS